jgi:hypothetical protein
MDLIKPSIKKHRKLFSLMVAALLLIGLVPHGSRAATCPCTIWASTATPATITTADPASVELGLKFQADTAGSVTGIRFYKGPQNTGTHTGSLWTSTGNRVATATFTNESASGWQQVNFAQPVNISSNTTYVASYFAPAGNYSSTSGGLNTAVDNAPLHALSAGTAGGNGVYTYGGSSFPTSTFNGTNYWVDPVFSSGTVTDTTPPTVSATSPASGAAGVAQGANATVTFSEAMDPTTVTTSSFELRNSSNALVAAAVTYNAANYSATLDPTATLPAGSYTATVKGGTTDPRVKDAAGNALAANNVWSFTVAAAPVLDQGPGGPVLVIKNDAQPFSKYYAEILRAEGLDSFATQNLSAVTSTMLNSYDVVVLGDMTLTSAQVTMLTNWVTAGGNLIAMHPDKKLAGLLGLTDQAATLSEGYMKPASSGPAAGITQQTMQYHGTADKYALTSGATSVATLYSNATTATTNPAVSLRTVGTAGGQAAAFTYDLAKSIVYSHQGNPAWAGQDRDGNGLIRPNDLYYGNKTGDVQADYIDLNKVAIPQADEQQRLLSNLIASMNQDKKPLPKFWYFPKGAKAVVVMAGDDHATPTGTKDSFTRLINASPAGCNVANWDCARSSSLMYDYSPMTNTEAAAYEGQGFDIGSHTSTGCADWTPASLEAGISNDLAAFQSKYTSLPVQHVNRIHCLAWSDWATAPKTEATHGLRLDLNYYYWPGAWVLNRPGFMTGSGLPMRFGDTDGSMIDVYEVPSNLVNEAGKTDTHPGQTWPDNINLELDRALGAEGYYGAFGTHYDYSDNFDSQLLASAQARGVPLVSGQQMLDWTDQRNASSFTGLAWSASTLNFTATVPAGAGTMMRGMLPLGSSKGTLTGVKKSGVAVPYTVDTIKGVSYAMFQVTSGSYAATYAPDTTAPTVSSTVPAASATNVDGSANLTATFSENMNASTVTGTTFTLKTSGGTLVPGAVSYNPATKVATLDPAVGLTPGGSYTATITGGSGGVKDIAGNALAANKVWSFTVLSSNCPCSLWNTATTPANISASDNAAVEVGTKFKSDIAGKITGIRFYKGPTNTGTHTITLWDTASGAPLGTATVSSETTSGWQTGTFATPINISAGTTYTASYFAPVGGYSFDSAYFSTAKDSGTLHGLSNATSPNGVYTYGGGIPTSSFNATNYWVDVVFTP